MNSHAHTTSSRPADSPLGDIRGWLLDLDGVMYRGESVIPGAADFVEMLRAEGVPFLFVTNNSTRTPAQYARRLKAMGIRAEPREFYTSALATGEHLSGQAVPGAPVLMIGMDGLREALGEAGFRLVDQPADAEYCVVGFSRDFCYDDLARASAAIRSGATFIGTNPDPTLPVEGGFTPGNGSLLAAIATASDAQPVIIGKPSSIMLNLAIKRLGLEAGECALLGDRLDTDIAGGNAIGLFTVLILTGSTTSEEANAADIRPRLVVRDMGHLMEIWKASQETAPKG